MKTIKVQFNSLPKTSNTPILTYCRKLIKDGEDPNTRLEVYRTSEEFDIAISSIGEGAKLGISEDPYLRLVKYRLPNVKQCA